MSTVQMMIEGLEARRLLAAQDFSGVFPSTSVTVDGTAYFIANDGTHGKELWKSDGTVAGTVIVKDIVPGPVGANPLGLVVVQGKVLFFRREALNVELWASDGTDAGTFRLHDFGPTYTNSDPNVRVIGEGANKRLVILLTFAADSGAAWSSDGTIPGTIELHAFDRPVDQGAQYLAATNGKVIFFSLGRLWATDGTLAGTVDINPGNFTLDSHFDHLTEHEGKVYFDVEAPEGLYVTDGTAAGTEPVLSWPANRLPDAGVHGASDGQVFFGTYHDEENDTVVVRTLWATDSTQTTSSPLHEFRNTFTGDFQIRDEWLIFSARGHDSNENQVWISDGTAGGTQQLPLTQRAQLGSIVDVGGVTFFVVDQNTTSWKVYKMAGAAPVLVKSANQSTSVKISESGGKLSIQEYSGNNVIRTSLVDPGSLNPLSATPAGMSVKNGVLRVHGTTGNDAIRFYRSPSDSTRFTVNLNGVKRTFAFSAITQIQVFGYSGADNIAFYDGYGEVYVRSRIWGGDDNDTIYAGNARDTIYGDGGNDSIGSGWNHDVVAGGLDDDTINASNGNDTATGDEGVDVILGGAGIDVVGGGESGQDSIDAGTGADVIFGSTLVKIFFAGDLGNDPSGLDELLLL